MDTGLRTPAEETAEAFGIRFLYVCQYGKKCSTGGGLHRVCAGCVVKIQVIKSVRLDDISEKLNGQVVEVIVCPLVQAKFDQIEAAGA